MRQKNRLIPHFASQKGQLHMSETLIAIMIILVFASSIANVASFVAEREENIEWISSRGFSILSAADEAKILRPAVYLANKPVFSSNWTDYKTQLEIMIHAGLPASLDFALVRLNFTASFESEDRTIIIGSQAAQTSYPSTVVVTYILGGFSSSDFGYYDTLYLVRLKIWKQV